MMAAKRSRVALLWVAINLILCCLPAMANDTEYKLGSGDIIRIVVYGEGDLTVEAQLTDAGVVSLPLLGQVRVNGLAPGKLEENIARRLLDGYLVDPRVSVLVLQYRSFFVNGQVGRPGAFEFQPGLTVRKAVSLAQGFTDKASKRDIYIISDSDPRQAQRRVGLNASIMPGDIITVH